jgi:hypothetical protein
VTDTNNAGVVVPMTGRYVFTTEAIITHVDTFSVCLYGVAISGTPTVTGFTYLDDNDDTDFRVVETFPEATYDAGTYRFRFNRNSGTGDINVQNVVVRCSPIELRPS